MAKSSKAVETKGLDDWKRRVSFDFGKEGLKEAEGFHELTINETVTVLVTGKVNHISKSRDGASFSLTMEGIKLQVKPKEDPLTAAFAGHRMKVTK